MNYAPFLSALAVAGAIAGPLVNIPDKPQLEITPQEIAAHRVAEESFLNTLAGLCGDPWAGSQVLRIQAELKSRNVQHATICEGREHPLEKR